MVPAMQANKARNKQIIIKSNLFFKSFFQPNDLQRKTEIETKL